MVPVEVWEDEPFERTEIQKVIEDRKVPQVGVLVPYFFLFRGTVRIFSRNLHAKMTMSELKRFTLKALSDQL